MFTCIREDWVSKQMKQREQTFTDIKELVFLVGTWNVNAKKPLEPLNGWLLPPSLAAEPDVYIIG